MLSLLRPQVSLQAPTCSQAEAACEAGHKHKCARTEHVDEVLLYAALPPVVMPDTPGSWQQDYDVLPEDNAAGNCVVHFCFTSGVDRPVPLQDNS